MNVAARAGSWAGWMGVAAVSSGAAVGAVARAAIATAAGSRELWFVLGINAVGAFVLGLAPCWRAVRCRPVLAALIGPGFLGGFTTVSAWSGHTVVLLADAEYALAAAYVALGVLTAYAAAAVGRRVATHRLAGAHPTAPRQAS